MALVIKTSGLDHLGENSRTVFRQGTSRMIRRVTIAIQAASLPFVPVDKGFLRNSIGVTLSTFLGKVEARAPYAIFVHEGTAPHVIAAKNRKVLSDGSQIFGKRVNHPGTKAQPFFTRGIRASEAKITSLISQDMDNILEDIFS